MLQCWAHKPEDRPTFVALRDFLVEVGVGWKVSGGPHCPFAVQSEGGRGDAPMHSPHHPCRPSPPT